MPLGLSNNQPYETTQPHNDGRKCFYLTMHSTHFILRLYGVGHMVKNHSEGREKTRGCHIGYSFRLTAGVLLYAPSHRQNPITTAADRPEFM